MDQMLHLYKILLIYSTGSGWVKSKLERVAMGVVGEMRLLKT